MGKGVLLETVTLKQRIALLYSSDRNAFLIKGSIGILLISIFGRGVAFGVQIFLARVLGVQQYGIYIYVIEWVTFLTLFTSFGLDTTLLRFVPDYQVKKEWGSFRGVILWSNQLAFGISLGVGILGLVIISLLKTSMAQQVYNTFLIGWGILPFFTAIKLCQAVLRSLRKVIFAQLLESVLRLLLLVFLVVVLTFGILESVNAQMAMILNALAYIVTFTIGFVWMYRQLPVNAKKNIPQFHTSKWLRVTVPLFLIAGANMLFRQTDKLMVGMFLGTTAAGIYATSSRIAVLLMFGVNAVNIVIAPMISELFAKKQIYILQQTVTLAAIGIFLFTVPMAILMVVFGEAILNLFGAEFLVGYAVLVILVIGQSITALTGSVSFLMMMTGYQNRAAQISGGVAILNVVLNMIFIPILGIEGAAVATMVSLSLWHILLFVYVKRHIGIDPTIFSIMKMH